jgi:hypothetical protein
MDEDGTFARDFHPKSEKNGVSLSLSQTKDKQKM